jgi:murein tripeptide amidase MpaA
MKSQTKFEARSIGNDGRANGWKAWAFALAATAALALNASAAAQAVLPGDEPNGEYPGYWSWPAMVAKVEQYASEHPNLVRVQPIGKTYEGRDILAVKITSDVAADDPEKPELLFMAGIHAREQMPQVALMRFIDELISGYGTDARVTRLLDSRALWAIPVYNVDGKVYDFKNGNGATRGANQRITREPFDENRRGVDLNRNNLVGWGSASNNPGSQTYHGPGPNSTPEAKALFNFMASRRFRVFLDIHSNSRTYILPPHLIREEAERYGFLTRGLRTRQLEPYRGSLRGAESEARPGSGTGVGQTHVVGLYVHGAYSIVYELGLRGFYPPAEETIPHYEENIREPWFFLLEEAVNLPAKRQGDFTLVGAKTSAPATPGATVQWIPEVEGEVAYGVLVSRDGAIRVTGDYRLYPIRDELGHTLNVAESAEAGKEAPMNLYLWDRDRRQSVVDFTVKIEAGGRKRAMK